ncbi:MAG TPA: glycosyltransferase family 39 protein [Lacipirellulaceae bacterium]|nr:glycosyltransferase family 39 protein [Lacipirellulaceae bacterium]
MDAWDQKPPAIAFLYSLFLKVWPGEAVVPAADIAAAGVVACLLVLLGRSRFSSHVGFGAAAVFLLAGDPYLQRMSGIFVRGQCEPFISLAIASSLVLIAYARGRRLHLIGAGAALAMAVWLKYNAITYALPVAIASCAWSPETDREPRSSLSALAFVALGFAIVSSVFFLYLTANGALHDWRLATIDYNIRYANETYDTPASIVRYFLTFPIERARLDMLWFLGGLGVLLLVPGVRLQRSTLVIFGWLLAAVLSIAINGSRSLPNYFVQANPALALAASAGLATLAWRGTSIRVAMGALLLAALWRVGPDAPAWGFRLASLPGLVNNIRFDLRYLRGEIGRDAYLQRFSGRKHDADENEHLTRFIRAHSSPRDPVFVFGFSGGSVGWKSERVSPSRFYWSHPILIEFAAELPGYGSAGLLEDLRRRPPAIVVLQKEEWRSYDFFMSNKRLRHWLDEAYRLDHTTPMFAVYRRIH